MGLKYTTTVITTVDVEDFKNKIRRLGMSQNEIAKDLGISISMLSRWMNGITRIPESMYETLDKYIDEKSKEVMKFWESTIREETEKVDKNP